MAAEKYRLPEKKRFNFKLMQRLLPTQFSLDKTADEDLPHIFPDAKVIKLNVYRLRDSSLGFYHTGLEFDNREYTYCCGIGICYHKPKRCHFAVHLGTKTLGYVEIDSESFQTILRDMHQAGGFATEDYDVMEKSCNNFTYSLAEKLKVDYSYPTAILKQSRMGSFLAPVAHALDIVAERSSISWATYDDGEESYSLLCRRKSCNVRRSMSSISIYYGDKGESCLKKSSSAFSNIFRLGPFVRARLPQSDQQEDVEMSKIPNLDDV